jgi:molybdate transport system substrate-binding protein
MTIKENLRPPRLSQGDAETFSAGLTRRSLVSVGGLLATGLTAHPLIAQTRRPDTLTVLAASDLSAVWPHLMRTFAQSKPSVAVRVSFGSSGNFLRQISDGLPFDLFLTADFSHVQRLVEEGRAVPLTKPWIKGNLALSYRLPLPSGSQPTALSPQSVKPLLDSVRWLAIANPHHAPYGKAAQQTLESWGLWGPIQSRLVTADSAAQAAQFLFQGGAQAALLPRSLVTNLEAAAQQQWQIQHGQLTFAVHRVPATSHQRILHGMAISHNAGDSARNLMAHLHSPETMALLEKYGFERVQDT